MFAAFLHHENAGRNACPVEDIGRKPDNCVNVVFLFNQVTPDFALGSTAEQYTVWRYASHRAAIVEVVKHMQDESIVGFRFGGEHTGFTETIVVVEFCRSTPVC